MQLMGEKGKDEDSFQERWDIYIYNQNFTSVDPRLHLFEKKNIFSAASLKSWPLISVEKKTLHPLEKNEGDHSTYPPPSAPPSRWNSKKCISCQKTFAFPFRSMLQVPAVRVAWCRKGRSNKRQMGQGSSFTSAISTALTLVSGPTLLAVGTRPSSNRSCCKRSYGWGSEVDTSEWLPFNGEPFGVGSYSYLHLWRTTGKHTSFFWQNSAKFHSSSKATVPTPMLRWCLGWSRLVSAVGVSPEKESNLKNNNLEVQGHSCFC